ncbi:hypothetical protein FHY13_003141 [Xanthomonas arboricola]|uniref:sensor histidine kinase n=1 Tax=Xanthomonas euroxanthea TaxID=2259622 RepID=UPI001619382E|nr:ATP-binding protein [Xanthomonas euroxanthea]MBB3814770.1 hypothetical protein [Xanthomonas euroxanthea]
MKRLWRSTFGLLALVSAIFAIATVAVGLTVYEVSHEALEQQLDHRIANETHALLDEAASGGTSALIRAVQRRQQANADTGLFYLLVDQPGNPLAGNLEGKAPTTDGYLETLQYDGGLRSAQALTTRLADGVTLVVAADRGAIEETDAIMLRLGGIALGVTFLLGIGASWLIGAATRDRLRKIDQAARAIIEGDLSRRIPIEGSTSEFDRVAVTLNTMLDRIHLLVENLRQVSNDVAHDLRTPLTKLTNQLNQALAAADAEVRQVRIASALQQSHELQELFSALLRISEIETFQVRRRFERVKLDVLVLDVIDSYTPDAEASGHRLSGRVDRGIVLEGDRRLLHQLLANALDNALRHTPAQTTVTITLRASPQAVTLRIEDDGPGVDKAEIPHLLKRFHRGERSRTVEGNGLGLALVSAITLAHRGSVTIDSDAGFCLDFNFPR